MPQPLGIVHDLVSGKSPEHRLPVRASASISPAIVVRPSTNARGLYLSGHNISGSFSDIGAVGTRQEDMLFRATLKGSAQGGRVWVGANLALTVSIVARLFWEH